MNKTYNKSVKVTIKVNVKSVQNYCYLKTYSSLETLRSSLVLAFKVLKYNWDQLLLWFNVFEL